MFVLGHKNVKRLVDIDRKRLICQTRKRERGNASRTCTYVYVTVRLYLWFVSI